MKFNFRMVPLATLLLVLSLGMGCSTGQVPVDKTERAINDIRTRFELPILPVEFVEMTTMINSPDGSLEVALYRDADGRTFSVDLRSNRVVEIDARNIIVNIPLDTPTLPFVELKVKANRAIRKVIANFDLLEVTLTYEEGEKGDYFFFTWYGENQSGALNRPFAQIGLHKSGKLFAYYNTLEE